MKPARLPTARNSSPAAAPAATGDRRVTVKLTYPIQAHGEETYEVTLRPPNAGDLGECDGMGEITMTLHMIHLCGGIPPSSVRQIDGADLGKFAAVFASFFGSGRATGKKA